MNIGRAVVTLREQRHSLAIGRFANFRERDRSLLVAVGKYETAGKFDRVKIAAQHPSGNLR